MNWGGFPIGFRFPVQDFSFETKKRCWSYVLPALAYADLTDCTLQEAESAELFDPEQLIYIAIISPKKIRVNRKNGLLWRRDGRLMSALSLYEPAVQENYLELYTHPRILADVTPERNIVPREGGEGVFPDHIESRPKMPSHHRALILPKGELPYGVRLDLCRRTMERLYEEDPGLYLGMLPLSPGGEGAAYTAAAFQHGRFFSEMVPDGSGQEHRCFFGVLPGRRLLIDGFSVPEIGGPICDEYGLGKAIRLAKERGFTDVRLCATGLDVPPCGIDRIREIEELYALSKQLPLYDRVILTELDPDGGIKTEAIDVDRRDPACVSSILSKRSGTAKN